MDAPGSVEDFRDMLDDLGESQFVGMEFD